MHTKCLISGHQSSVQNTVDSDLEIHQIQMLHLNLNDKNLVDDISWMSEGVCIQFEEGKSGYYATEGDVLDAVGDPNIQYCSSMRKGSLAP